MNLTLKQWLELDAGKKAIQQAVTNLDSLLMNLLLEHGKSQKEREFILDFSERLVINLPDCHPVCEWTGGDSSDPKNSRWREPQSCGLSNRRYFTDAEVEESGAPKG